MKKRYLVVFTVLCSLAGSFLFPWNGYTKKTKKNITLNKVTGPITLNDHGRGLFSSLLLYNSKVIATYQIAKPTTLRDGKHLYYKVFDRNLKVTSGQKIAINVKNTFYKGDLGDHKLTKIGNSIYMIALLKGRKGAAIIKMDSNFKRLSKPFFIGRKKGDRTLDMGFASDGKSLYAQFFFQINEFEPSTWKTSLYKVNTGLNQVSSNVVTPSKKGLMSGSSLVYVPKGVMGAKQDQIQAFTVNRDHGNPNVGIQTFAVNASDLKLIKGSRKDIIKRKRRSYFPTGTAWNKKHNIWFIGYTMEQSHKMAFKDELGPSFVDIFNKNFRLLKRIQINKNKNAFRVMLKTDEDDLYVVFDEMDGFGKAKKSLAKIEHYKIVKK